jgi:uncharacterized protein YndB with AHSA1/START domain
MGAVIRGLANVGEFHSDNKMVWARRISTQPERLWDAIATKDGLSRWFMPTSYEIKKNGRFSFEGGWDGTVSELKPFQCIQFDADGGSGAFLRFEMEAGDGVHTFALIDRMGDGVEVNRWLDAPPHRRYQPGGPGTHWSGVAAGYHAFVDALEDHLSGSTVSSDYDELCKAYQRILDARFGPEC